jgi:hypothetical protein
MENKMLGILLMHAAVATRVGLKSGACFNNNINKHPTELDLPEI